MSEAGDAVEVPIDFEVIRGLFGEVYAWVEDDGL